MVEPVARYCEFCGLPFQIIKGIPFAEGYRSPAMIGRRRRCECAGAKLWRELVGCPGYLSQEMIEKWWAARCKREGKESNE